MGVNLLQMRRRTIIASQPHLDAQTGSLLTWTKCAGVPLRSCLLTFGPVQEGTGDPSPSNVRPVSGRTGVTVYRAGKNLIDDTIKYVAGDTTVFVGANNNNYNIYLKAGTYTISCVFADDYGMFYREQNDNANKALWYSGSPTRSAGFTTESGGYYRFWVYRNSQAGGVDPSGVISVQLELGSTDTPYEPYTGQTVEVQFPDSAGTVYGGTLDLITGDLTATWGVLDLGSLTYNAEGDGNGNLFSSNSTKGVIKPAAWSANVIEAVCPIYTGQTGSDTYKGTQDGSIGTDGNGKLYIYDSTRNGMTAAEFKTSLSGVQLVYALPNPVAYQVDPATVQTLSGVTNLWSDADTITASAWTY